MKIGDKRKLNCSKFEYTVVDILEGANLPLEWDWIKMKCPHCNKDIVDTKNYTIDTIEVLENKDGKMYLGFTKEQVSGGPLTMQLPDKNFHPDKDMTKAIEDKIKEKTNG